MHRVSGEQKDGRCKISWNVDERLFVFRVPFNLGAKQVVCPYIFTVKCHFRAQDILRLQKNIGFYSCGGGARGSYVARGLISVF